MLHSSQKLLRLQALRKALRAYLPDDKYRRLVRKLDYSETESIWPKLEYEVKALEIPKDPKNEKCVRIYAALYDLDCKEAKKRLLNSNA